MGTDPWITERAQCLTDLLLAQQQHYLATTLTEKFQSLFHWLVAQAEPFMHPWLIYQVVIIAACYGLARLITRWLEPRLEIRVRGVRGKPGLTRFLAILLRNTHWVVLFCLLTAIWYAMQHTTWPSRSYLIWITARLVVAWVGITAISKVIRNRTLSRFMAVSCWAMVALGMLGELDDTLRIMDSIGFSIGDFRFSLLKVFKGMLLLVFLLWLTNTLGRIIDRQVQSLDGLNPSLKVLTGKISRIILICIAFLVVLSSFGIDLTALTVFSGALGVGIGIGMQKVVSNFLSGIIILMDKSIKPGDSITLGDTFGWIRELRARFVSVVTRDGREYLIPNEDFVTQQVINWSYTDKLVRLDVPFGVSYDSDPHEVSRLAIASCAGLERISKTKAPACWLTEFGDSSLNFVLRFWIEDPENGLTNIRGKVLLGLWDVFKAHDVSIPFPHREIILKGEKAPGVGL